MRTSAVIGGVIMAVVVEMDTGLADDGSELAPTPLLAGSRGDVDDDDRTMPIRPLLVAQRVDVSPYPIRKLIGNALAIFVACFGAQNLTLTALLLQVIAVSSATSYSLRGRPTGRLGLGADGPSSCCLGGRPRGRFTGWSARPSSATCALPVAVPRLAALLTAGVVLGEDNAVELVGSPLALDVSFVFCWRRGAGSGAVG